MSLRLWDWAAQPLVLECAAGLIWSPVKARYADWSPRRVLSTRRRQAYAPPPRRLGSVLPLRSPGWSRAFPGDRTPRRKPDHRDARKPGDLSVWLAGLFVLRDVLHFAAKGVAQSLFGMPPGKAVGASGVVGLGPSDSLR
jgi:hypothetical protein